MGVAFLWSYWPEPELGGGLSALAALRTDIQLAHDGGLVWPGRDAAKAAAIGAFKAMGKAGDVLIGRPTGGRFRAVAAKGGMAELCARINSADYWVSAMARAELDQPIYEDPVHRIRPQVVALVNNGQFMSYSKQS